ALRWRATFLTSDGRRVSGDWSAAASAKISIDAPPDLVSTTDVQVIAAGSFDGVAQLIVELRTGAGADVSELRFTQAGQAQTWKPRVAPGAVLHYQSRLTVLGADGLSRAFDWTDQDSPLLVASDQSRFT